MNPLSLYRILVKGHWGFRLSSTPLETLHFEGGISSSRKRRSVHSTQPCFLSGK